MLIAGSLAAFRFAESRIRTMNRIEDENENDHDGNIGPVHGKILTGTPRDPRGVPWVPHTARNRLRLLTN